MHTLAYSTEGTRRYAFSTPIGFNLAMIGKQSWKLQTEQNTIVTQICKAKYSLRTDWRVGNGMNISVWEDPWLLLEENPFISSLIINGLEHSKVEDLFNLDGIT